LELHLTGLLAHHGEPIRFLRKEYTATLLNVFIAEQEGVVCSTLKRLGGDKHAVPVAFEVLKVEDFYDAGTQSYTFPGRNLVEKVLDDRKAV